MSEFQYDGLKLENQLCFPLYAASREVVRLYKPFLDELNLTYTQYITMLVLWEEKQINVKDLGNKLFLDSGTLTPLLRSLEKKGFVTRQRSQKDERVLLVGVTEKGYELRDEALHVPTELTKCVSLNAEESLELYKLLYKLLGK